MKTLFYFLIAALILFSSNFGKHLAQDNNTEFRATWVITWEYINSGSSVETNKARIRTILDNHKKANMTSVLFQVRQSGTAYYQSSYEPWGYYAGYTYPGFDPLEYAVEEAHKRGLELHAWFNTFSVASTISGTVANEHPEWICRDRDGNPMTSHIAVSPGLQAVRDYTVSVAMEIVRNYDIDGLHLDYVRWNEYDTSDMADAPLQIEQESKLDGVFSSADISKFSSPESLNRFLYDIEHPYNGGVPSGFSSWEDWWRWSVTEFVKTLHDSIQAEKPWVRLTPAALGKYKTGGPTGWNGYYVVYQDAALWFNMGYVDQLTPMHYHWLTGEDLFNAVSADWEPNIQPGIQAGRLYTCGPGSYRLDENNVWTNHPGIVNRMRDKAWVDGFQFFSYGSWRDHNYWDEAGSTFFGKIVKVRNAFQNSPPGAPSISLVKVDSLNYKINVHPDPASVGNNWFAIYRSEDNILNTSEDKIVSIFFDDSTFSFVDTYTGFQNFNGTYKYFATSLNRYWNESEPSNMVITDPVPSFAPTVTSTYPAENGIFNLSGDIVIEFSKSMDISSFSNSLSFTPNVQIVDLTWNETATILSIISTGHQYQTSYTLRIDSTVSDVNGRKLDGNADGIEGDPFFLHYQTNEEDVTGPEVVFTYPAANDTNIDAASVIILLFDEPVEGQSLSADDISLSSSGLQIDFSYQLTQSLDGRAVLCVQPTTNLLTSTEYNFNLSAAITDTLGNSASSDYDLSFTTSEFSYSAIKMIDNFTVPGDWKQPSYSGSTKGIVVAGTAFDFTSEVSLPATNPKKAARLTYEWDINASDFLIREYLAGGTPQSTYFDTSYVLQTYLFGDGSGTKFRFCIDEYTGSAWGDHEVSKWVTVDWHGWKLVEWKLNDPNSVGVWIGDGNLTGQYFRIDSYQLTKTPESQTSGVIYFDDLRAVNKVFGASGSVEETDTSPESFILLQNYPNPFNPSTVVHYQLASAGHVTLKVFDILGKEVAILVDEYMPAGRFDIRINAGSWTSGVYFYQLRTGDFVDTKKMILVK